MDSIPFNEAFQNIHQIERAQQLLNSIEAGGEIEASVNALRGWTRASSEEALADDEKIRVVGLAAQHAFFQNRHDIAQALLRTADPMQWTKGMRKLQRKIFGESSSQTQSLPSSGSASIEAERGNFSEAHRLAMNGAATTHIEQLGMLLLNKGYPQFAADIAMKIIKEKGAPTNQAGYNLGALNLLARAARADQSLYGTLLQGIELAEQKGLPPEYGVRIIFLYETGKVYKQSKVRTNRDESGFLSTDTRRTIDTLRVTGGFEELPDLDATGDLKREFLSLLEQQRLFDAGKLICTFPIDEKWKAYEIRMIAAINKACPFSELEKLAAIFHNRRKILTAVLRKAISSHPFNSAFALFMAYGSDDARYSRSVGDGLVHTENGEKPILQGAQALLEMGKPRSALELLKPKILVTLVGSKKQRLPIPILHIFARAARMDSEILESLIEQLGEYRQRDLISDAVIDRLLPEAMAVEQQAKARQRIVSAKRAVESDADFKGRITRSKFFADPHTVLRSVPIDRVAARVATNRDFSGVDE